MTAKEIINLLDLKPLPDEGGYYKENYRSQGIIPTQLLPNHIGNHTYCTSIYYLITPTEFSHLHRLRTDELYHFYAGDPVDMIHITPEGELKKILIGARISSKVQPQVLAPAGVWQGSRLVDGGKWALLGCTMAPGFEFSDFELGKFETLVKKYPQHEDMIRCYTGV
jgi:predicted cupin superfamily sugar epimerase